MSEKEYEEVRRAIRVASESDVPEGEEKKTKINPDIFFAKKEPTKKSVKKSKKESTMANESTVIDTPKRKRGRPPGSKKIVSTEVMVKGKRGRPPSASKGSKKPIQAKTSKAKRKGNRFSDQDKKLALDFIQKKGRGGIGLASKEFKISYPTLAKWMKEEGVGKSKSKVERSSKKLGRPKKFETVSSGHVLISKKTIKAFQKGLSNLEIAFGHFADALRVFE